MPYTFTFADNNQQSYKLFNTFLYFFHVIVAAVFTLKITDQKAIITLYVLLGFYMVIGIAYLFFKNRRSALETFSLVLALLYTNFWIQHVSIFVAIIFVLLFVFVTMIKGKKTTARFSKEGVELSRVFKTVFISWVQLQNVVLKDNLLTIDFKTNKILQVEIKEDNPAVDELEFNQFCNQQLHSKSS